MRTLDTLLILLLPAALATPAAAQSPVLSTYGTSEGAAFGAVVERIGDVDADGTPDFAVGAPYSDETIFIPFALDIENAGAVSVFSGVTGELIWKAVGPLTGDSEFGSAIADAGDVDFDGRADVLVGLPAASGLAAGSGSVQLLSGASGALLRTFPGSQTGERYGASICTGSLDPGSPGIEVAIGAPFHDLDDSTGGFLQEGRVEIVSASTGAVLDQIAGGSFFVFSLPFTDEYVRRGWGHAVECIGDSDNDGYGTLLVSAPFTTLIDESFQGTTTYTNTGFVLVTEPFHPQASFSTTWLHGDAGDLLGVQLESFSHDLDGDGDVDWAAYAPGSNELRVYSGLVQPLFTSQAPCIDGLTSVDSVGDVDQDGTSELAIGVPGVGADTGHVCLISGTDGGFVDELFGPAPGSRYGSAVAGADMDGDGRSEVWVGARSDDTAFTDAGAVFVESESDCLPASWKLYGTGTAGTLGIPTLACWTNPILGTDVGVQMSSVTTFETVAAVLIGIEQVDLPVLGGQLLVLPLQVLPVTLPTPGAVIALEVPDKAPLCGLKAFVQAVQANPDAPEGWAFSPGIELTLGN